MTEENIFQELHAAEQSVEDAKKRLEGLTAYIEKLKKEISENITLQIQAAKFTRFNPDMLPAFLNEPYVVIPKKIIKDKAVEWTVIAPKFIDLQLGWLERSTASYNIFTVNQYSMIFARIPKELEQRFQLKPVPGLKVADGLLVTTEETQPEAWERYKRHLLKREGSGAIRIRRGHEFLIIAQIIEDGGMPFIPRSVDAADLRQPIPSDIALRDYQIEGWNIFLKYGATGIFWPFSSGKSFMGAYACAAIKGPKLVIVPTVTLKEQWLEYLQKHTQISQEVQIETYQAFHKVQNRQYTLTIYDECQHLPANTFIKLATINTKYRMGFSGSPYREDGRVNYIIALTGYPQGLAWEKFFELGIIHKPAITVMVVETQKEKLDRLKELLHKGPGKTVIFCDGIELGKRIAAAYALDFVFSETSHRLETIRENEIVVVSRVGDEGVSLPDLDTIIEIDFLYGSRMQESQRMGRLLHSKKEATNHYILMTEQELESYGKRLFALYERGFRVNILR